MNVYTQDQLTHIKSYLDRHIHLTEVQSVAKQTNLNFSLDDRGFADLSADEVDILNGISLTLTTYDEENAAKREAGHAAKGHIYILEIPADTSDEEAISELVQELVDAGLPTTHDGLHHVIDDLMSRYKQEREIGAEIEVGLRHGTLTAEVNSPIDDTAGIEVKFENQTVALIEETADGRGVRVLHYKHDGQDDIAPDESIVIENVDRWKESE